MKQFSVYGGKVKWNSNEGMAASIKSETTKALLLTSSKGDFWISKSIYQQHYDYYGFTNKVLFLPRWFQINLITTNTK
jgi:hypothetical protein